MNYFVIQCSFSYVRCVMYGVKAVNIVLQIYIYTSGAAATICPRPLQVVI